MTSHENPVRVFTDEDLAQLKEDLQSAQFFFNGMDDRLRPLLHRLECSEAIVVMCDGNPENRHHSTEKYQKAHEAWRKSSGKTNE